MRTPSDQSNADPWAIPDKNDHIDHSGQPEVQFTIKTITEVTPLDGQIGIFPKNTVPEPLHGALFGNTGAEARQEGKALAQALQTYALLDAAKITNLPELLERSGLEHSCLFTGRAYDELKHAAPWIVRLEDGNSFARNLFTRSDAARHLWHNEAGIYLRSRASIADLQRHFRRFTRVRDASEAWYLFRFWDPKVAQVHFAHLFEVQNLWQNWFTTQFGKQISALIICRASGEATIYSPALRPVVPERRAFTMTQPEIDKFRLSRMDSSLDDISRRLHKHRPQESLALLRLVTDQVAGRFLKHGLRQKASLFALSWYELQHGPIFERHLDPEALAALRDGTKDEEGRIRDMRAIMDGKFRRIS